VCSSDLLIQDGPGGIWWTSPDIWIEDPNMPGTPVSSPQVGKNYDFWVRVHNKNQNCDVIGVTVNCYWAIPATSTSPFQSTLLGKISIAKIPAGDKVEDKCNIQWVPQMLNGGHECLVAAAYSNAEPLPSPLPDTFSPDVYDQIAQRNLSVVNAIDNRISQPINILGLREKDKKVEIITEIGKALDKELLKSLGIKYLQPAREKVVEIGLGYKPLCIGDTGQLGPGNLELCVPKGSYGTVYVNIKVNGLPKGEYQPINVIERNGNYVVGGYSFIVINLPQR